MQPDPTFFEIQTASAWGQTLLRFAEWCLVNLPPGAAALDVGCGPGLLPAQLAQRGATAFGVDVEFIPRTARLHPRLAQADALRLPFPGAAFDLVCASNLLFLLPDPQQALQEMARLLRPGATLAVLNPSERMSVAAAAALADARRLSGLDRQSLLGWAARAESHHRWDEPALARLLASAGLTMTHSVLKIGPGLARWARAVRPK
jgi:SAM-dependent methyltransferase